MPLKKPRFFCDNCGAEVGMTAKSCPACGRFFASVRCPKCGYTGRDDDFAHGCPSCGYSAPPPVAESPPGNKNSGRNPQKGTTSEPLPVWMYVLASLILIFVLVILYNSLR
jgi:uncharacterized membrane protein YvbJ